MPLYSDSRLNLYEECPRAYLYKYIEGVEVEGVRNAYAFLGSRVHETLEVLHEDLKNGKKDSLDYLLNYYGTKWKNEWDPDVQVPEGDYSEEHFKEVGRKCIKNYYDKHEPFERTDTVDTELRLHPKVESDGKEYTFLGFIDRLAVDKEGNYEIHDYKTSKRLPTKDDLESDRQLKLYQLGVEQEYPDADEVELVWHYVRFGKDIRISHSREGIDRLQEELVDLIGDIERSKEEDDFPTRRNEGARCDWCDFKELCPEWSHLYETEGLSQNEFLSEDGVELVDKLADVERKLEDLEEERSDLKEKKRDLEDAILDYAEKNEVKTVFGTEKRASVERKEKVKFPKSNDPERGDLEDLLRESGLWDEVSYLSIRSLAKKFRNKEWPESIIDRLEDFKRLEEDKRVSLEDLED